jgi:PAS domain S-box-containing protein
MSTDSSKIPMISIVDDDRFVRQATDSLLQSLGYRTATFASAEDFLQSSYIHETTCLISDVQMPGLSGVDLHRVLIAQGHRMPVIFITAYFDERIRQSVMEAGAIGYLSKPFDEESLIGVIQPAAIVESSNDAIISKDLNGTVTTWNKAAERLFGYLAKEVVGESITILIPPDRRNEEAEIVLRIWRGERVDHFDTVRRRKDGSLVGGSLTVSPITDDSGKIIGASKIAREITE